MLPLLDQPRMGTYVIGVLEEVRSEASVAALLAFCGQADFNVSTVAGVGRAERAAVVRQGGGGVYGYPTGVAAACAARVGPSADAATPVHGACEMGSDPFAAGKGI